MARKNSKTKKNKFLKKLILLLIILIVLFALLLFLTPNESQISSNISSSEILNLELPTPIKGAQIVKHTGYTLSYNEEFELPNYVAYDLTRDEVYGPFDRKDNFRPDPSITTGSSTLDDYKNSGYDRGHLAPAADFKWAEEAMNDTFYMSNMAPQEPDFNRGIWADLESVTRQFAVDNEKIYIVTGPVLTDGPYKTIGKNKVAVPKNYYKVVLDYTDPEIKAIGFLLPGIGSKEELENFATSIDEVELVTGIDFFPALPDDQEDILEANFDVSKWNFKTFNPANAPEKILINPTQTSPNTELKDTIILVLFEIKKEIISYLGLTKLAKEFNIL